jgi:hypothetical protein
LISNLRPAVPVSRVAATAGKMLTPVGTPAGGFGQDGNER